MKILMIGFTSPEEGGSERHIYEIAKNISQATVLTQKSSLCKNKIELPKIGNSFIRNISFFFLCLVYSIKLLFMKKYDIIHLHENTLYFLAPLLKLRYKIVITVHGMTGFRFYDNKFLWFFFKIGLSFADALIAVNLEDEKKLKKHFKKVTYVPNGVDLTLYSKIKPKTQKKITFIGRMHEQKGIIYLLDAFSKLSKSNPSFKLELIGEINDYAKQFQKKYPIKNIIWRGSLTNRNEIIKSLKSAYCIVLPSLWEGLPLTLFESLAAERPLILSDIPAFKSVVKDEALFFKSKNSQDLSDKISILIKDLPLTKKLAQKGKILANDYTWDKISKKTLEVYQNA